MRNLPKIPVLEHVNSNARVMVVCPNCSTSKCHSQMQMNVVLTCHTVDNIDAQCHAESRWLNSHTVDTRGAADDIPSGELNQLRTLELGNGQTPSPAYFGFLPHRRPRQYKHKGLSRPENSGNPVAGHETFRNPKWSFSPSRSSIAAPPRLFHRTGWESFPEGFPNQSMTVLPQSLRLARAIATESCQTQG